MGGENDGALPHTPARGDFCPLLHPKNFEWPKIRLGQKLSQDKKKADRLA